MQLLKLKFVRLLSFFALKLYLNRHLFLMCGTLTANFYSKNEINEIV